MCITMNTLLDKAALRAFAKQRRQALRPEERAERSRRICEHLLALPELAWAGTVMSYMAMPSEADLGVLHEALWARGTRLCFPVTRSGGAMEAAACGAEGPWEEGAFGIREPAGGEVLRPEEIGLVLMPCLAFDERGSRLGWGGGYYDRYLIRCPGALRIGVGFELQRAALLPREEWDVPLQMLVTEEGLQRFG